MGLCRSRFARPAGGMDHGRSLCPSTVRGLLPSDGAEQSGSGHGAARRRARSLRAGVQVRGLHLRSVVSGCDARPGTSGTGPGAAHGKATVLGSTPHLRSKVAVGDHLKILRRPREPRGPKGWSCCALMTGPGGPPEPLSVPVRCGRSMVGSSDGSPAPHRPLTGPQSPQSKSCAPRRCDRPSLGPSVHVPVPSWLIAGPRGPRKKVPVRAWL